MKSSSSSEARPMVSVSDVSVIGPHRLALTFSDGRFGIHDFSNVRRRVGAKVAALADPDYFARTFVADGVLTWPNGYDWDPIALHASMASAGELSPPQAA